MRYDIAADGVAKDIKRLNICVLGRRTLSFVHRTDFHYGFYRLPSTFFQRSVRARMALDPAHNPLEGGVKGAFLASSLAPPQ